ncbi:XRE family transcriptional regulator [Amycolatopsis sp. NBC_01488]|uniref:helix-turn-helix domain-containing protein n=1 Tax=Amycolatopsis sp. NBC_01488 TaxID=2903563 RepID=UPI002E298E68|nr:helix-turn-helix domain-containing protein [Amycolatopsis sp. NBC_01488]
MTAVDRWTGQEAAALRAALRMTVRDFAARLGIGVRTVSNWEARREGITPLPEMQAVLDTVLAQADDDVQERFSLTRSSGSGTSVAAVSPASAAPVAPDLSLDVLMEWTTGDFRLSRSEAAEAIERFTASDMATRRAFLMGLSLLSGTPLVRQVQRWVAALPMAPVSTDQLGADQLSDLEQSVTFFRRWDASGAGGLHRKAVVGQLNAVAETLGEPHAVATERRLFQVAAELAQLAGWMTYDTGSFGLAQRYYLLALGACQHADAPDLGAKIVGDMTQMLTALGFYDDSLSLVQTALASLPRHGNALVRSELLGLEARACAQLGRQEASNARRAVDACIEAYQAAPPTDRPDWVHYMNQAEVECLAANAYTELALAEPEPKRALAHAAQAEQHTNSAIAIRGASYSRSRVLDHLRLGKVRLAQREPAEAANVGMQALEQANGMRSSVLTKWLTGLSDPLGAQYASVPAVAAFREALSDYLRVNTAGSRRESDD